MYLAVNSSLLYVNETVAPDDTSLIWLQTVPVRKFVPTCDFVIDVGVRDTIDGTKTEVIEVYEFETSPQVRVYSSTTQTWELLNEGYILKSSYGDDMILTDSDGVYLITTERK